MRPTRSPGPWSCLAAPPPACAPAREYRRIAWKTASSCASSRRACTSPTSACARCWRRCRRTEGIRGRSLRPRSSFLPPPEHPLAREDLVDALDGHGAADPVALDLVAAAVLEAPELILGLDAL